MSDYDILELGPLGAWASLTTPDGRSGKGFVDKMIDTQYIGLSANAFAPGTGTPYWHTHSLLEEIYLFLDGEGRMALDDEVVDVKAGTTIRVGQGVRRAIHANADSPSDLHYVCVRAGAGELKTLPRDAERQDDPFPWD